MIEQLNKHLALEITAHQLYNGFAAQFSFWCYSKLASYFTEASERNWVTPTRSSCGFSSWAERRNTCHLRPYQRS